MQVIILLSRLAGLLTRLRHLVRTVEPHHRGVMNEEVCLSSLCVPSALMIVICARWLVLRGWRIGITDVSDRFPSPLNLFPNRDCLSALDSSLAFYALE